MVDDNSLTGPEDESNAGFRDSVESSRIIAETASDAIITIDENSCILFVNRAAVKIFGYSIEEMLGAELTMLMPEYLRHVHLAGLKQYIDTGHRHISWEGVQLPGLHKSGRQISLELSFGEFQAHGQHFFTGIARDITSRKRDEHRLAVQHAVTRILAEAPSLDDVTPMLLETICTHLGWQVAALWRVESERNELQNVAKWRDQSSATGVEFEEVSRELRFALGDGFPGTIWARKEPIWVTEFGMAEFPRSSLAARENLHSAFGFPIVLGKEVLGVIELFSSETKEADPATLDTLAAIGSQIGQFIERKNGEAELVTALARAHEARLEAEDANRAKDEFLKILSHELRTPLTPIIGWVHMMQNGILPDTEFPKALSVISRNAYSLKRLINDLLDMSAILSGKMLIENDSVSLAKVLEESVDTMRSYIKDSNVQLTLKISAEAAGLTIKGDRIRLTQSFCNVLHNAIKFSADGGFVEVTCEATQSDAVVRILDHGEGMPVEFLPFVFERFRQADGSRTRAHGGLGLGLALVKSFVSAHGGTVEARSDGEGRGCVFTITLPREVPLRAVTEKAGSKPAREKEKERTRVLIVEDQPDTMEMLATHFHRRGFETLCCYSAAEALLVADRDHFDILISDIAMPSMDGLQLITVMRQRNRFQRVPAIALTGYASQADVAAAIAAGFDLHLSKPIDPDELMAVVEGLLASRNK